MTDLTCSVVGCDKPRRGRYCRMHGARLERHGDVNVVKKAQPKPPAVRFFPKVEFVDKWHDGTRCLEWTRTRSQGYGKFQLAVGKPVAAYRWLYEHWFGPVPAGLQLDHLCRNRACCNPAHLEPVTQAENARRGAKTVITDADREVIRRLHLAGVRATSIAAELGVGRDCVAYNVKKLGLEPHGDGHGSRVTRARADAALAEFRAGRLEVSA